MGARRSERRAPRHGQARFVDPERLEGSGAVQRRDGSEAAERGVSVMRTFARWTLRVLMPPVLALFASAALAAPLKIGVTLHPYYSFAANIVGDRAAVVPLIEAGNNPHNYTPQPNDMKRVLEMDALIVNGIGHDEWAFEIVRAAGVEGKLRLIYANDGVALIPLPADEGQAKVVNPHTFVSTTAAIQQIYTIARALGELDPDNAAYYRDNARAYATRIRRLKAEYTAKLADLDVSQFRCATMHGAYG